MQSNKFRGKFNFNISFNKLKANIKEFVQTKWTLMCSIHLIAFPCPVLPNDTNLPNVKSVGRQRSKIKLGNT